MAERKRAMEVGQWRLLSIRGLGVPRSRGDRSAAKGDWRWPQCGLPPLPFLMPGTNHQDTTPGQWNSQTSPRFSDNALEATQEGCPDFNYGPEAPLEDRGGPLDTKYH